MRRLQTNQMTKDNTEMSFEEMKQQLNRYFDLQYFSEDPPVADPPAGDKPPAADPPVADPPAADPVKADPPVAKVAPEKYEDFTLPEGMARDVESQAAFSEIARGLNLPQDGAQKLVDFQVGLNKKQEEANTAQIETWKKEVADLPNSEVIQASGKRILDDPKMGPGWKELLEDFPVLGDHPKFVKAMAAMGNELSEKFVHGDPQKGDGKTRAQRRYDHPTSNPTK